MERSEYKIGHIRTVSRFRQIQVKSSLIVVSTVVHWQLRLFFPFLVHSLSLRFYPYSVCCVLYSTHILIEFRSLDVQHSMNLSFHFLWPMSSHPSPLLWCKSCGIFKFIQNLFRTLYDRVRIYWIRESIACVHRIHTVHTHTILMQYAWMEKSERERDSLKMRLHEL